MKAILQAFLLTLAASQVAGQFDDEYCTVAAKDNCAVSQFNPPPARVLCNKIGALRSPASSRDPCFAQNTTECVNKCFTQADCASFSYSGLSQVCQFFTKPLTRMGFYTPANADKNTIYWNRPCWSRDCTVNLVQNPSFESGTGNTIANWTQRALTKPYPPFTRVKSQSEDGSFGLKCTSPKNGSSVLSQTITGLNKAKYYTFSFYYSATSPPNDGKEYEADGPTLSVGFGNNTLFSYQPCGATGFICLPDGSGNSSRPGHINWTPVAFTNQRVNGTSLPISFTWRFDALPNGFSGWLDNVKVTEQTGKI